MSELRSRRVPLPQIRYEGDLPILARRAEIAAAIERHPVTVVCGETGSGKSTQLPKICLELGRGIQGLIGHTQPRRIAARSIATRLAAELGVALGQEVGFKTRFADSTSPRTLVKLMTDGILLAESLHDRYLNQYDTIILDEAHERSLNIDFLIGYVQRVLARRRDLKLIVTSATIDAERFAQHFEAVGLPAPIIEVSGRTYPVEIRYQPLELDADTGETDLQQAIVDAAAELWRGGRGDILVFMPTERDIHETSRALRGALARGAIRPQDADILPLYARLSDREHARVFEPHGRPRIVIATNVAESSLTVPGIHYVIDPGTARVSRYSARSRTQRLPIEPVSRASADQRAGRCGRTAPGICIRLYAESDYAARDRFTMPEIQRTNLAAVILQAKALRLGDIEDYPFLEPPKAAAVREGYKTLFELGAIDDAQQLTPLGQKLARLPVDPRIGRMIFAAEGEGSLAEVLIVASVLEGQDPRVRPHEHREAADRAHGQFADAESDFLSLLKLWDFFHELKEKLSRNQLRKACAQNFLSLSRMNEWLALHRQLARLVHEAGVRPGPRGGDYGAIHRAILAGLLFNVAERGELHDYLAAGSRKCYLWPGSGLFRKQPRWIVAAESVETSQRFLRCCARIDPAWIEPLAPHLVERSYSEPAWDAQRGAAMVFERVTLFGLTIVPRRRVNLAPIDPPRARMLMLWHGLVEGEIELKAEFFAHNRRLRVDVEAWQKKLRRLDLFRGDEACYEFYDRAIPEDVCDSRALQHWWRGLAAPQRQALSMQPADLLRDEVDDRAVAERFPDALPAGRVELPLNYEFSPGEADDGVTVAVPIEAFAQLDAERLAWLVPGRLEEKIAAMIKSLPKPLRKQLVPAPDVARRAAGLLRFGEGSLSGQLAGVLSRLAGEPITADAFQIDKLAVELRMNIRVFDAEGKTLAEGRDLSALRAQLGAETPGAVLEQADDSPWQREGLRTWDFDLPPEVEIRRQGLPLRAFPALVDAGDSAALRLLTCPHRAERASRAGVRRLASFALRDPLRQQVEWFPDWKQWRLHAALLPDCDLKQQLTLLLADRAVIGGQSLPRSAEEFRERLRDARQHLAAAVQEVVALAGPLLAGHHRAQLALERLNAAPWAAARDDVAQQLAALTAPGFLLDTPWPWLRQYPRYFQAIDLRLERLPSDLPGDRAKTEGVRHWQELYARRAAEIEAMGALHPELEQFRWMIEEYRVSLFAQRLGTAMPVSEKRLERQWAKAVAGA